MFRQRLRLPHHLTFGILPRISRRPQRPSCSRSRTRFPSDRRTLLPLGSALTSLPSRCFFFFLSPFPIPYLRPLMVMFLRDEYYPKSFSSRRSSEFERVWFSLWPLNFSPFLFHFAALQCSYLRRSSNLSLAYEVNLIVWVLSSWRKSFPDLLNYRS